MKLALKLAYRNLIGAGLRTWLNVVVLSFSFVTIIWLKGVMTGWDYQSKTDMTNWEIGGGQYWHNSYDPYDPFSINDSHAAIPEDLDALAKKGEALPMLLIQGSIFPEGRMMPVTIRGVDPDQTLLYLPTSKLDTTDGIVPAIIGVQMAKQSRLNEGDFVTLRWRDANGTFDATDVMIAAIFSANVPAVDLGQIYIPLSTLQDFALLPGEATLITLKNEEMKWPEKEGWIFKSKNELTKQVDEMIKTKSTGQNVIYGILLLLAMLAIFDTQVMSIFRRQKEIGTYVALGYTRQEVVGLFTVEGSMHAVLAALLSAAYGMPFLIWMAKVGWTMPIDASEFGMAIAQTLYPIYTVGLVVGTVIMVTITTAIVSYLPSRKIAKMNPTDALRGKLQ
ncbi:MAG: FtsX-like permease family protein [Lentimicrobium sp.]|nr:FtsX-like permease family protein [Lentimicrobium sp.]